MMEAQQHDQYALALGKEVPMSEVDKALRLLWEADSASTNASLINLAVYSEEEGAIIKNSKIIQEITREHACRALLIGIDRDNPETSIRAWITAHCHLAQGKKSVCCEQIAFQLTGRATGRLRNTVFAHLCSDLPLVFWWQGELSDIFSERLYNLIDRFVFDSSKWEDPVASFRRIVAAAHHAESFLPMDLEWTRTYEMRVALAGLFDDPLAIQALEKVSKVQIVVNPDHRMAGMQFLAWVIQRTGWWRSQDRGVYEEERNVYYFETREGNDVTIELQVKESLAPMSLVEFSAPGCKVSVLREDGSPYLRQKLDAGCHQIDQCSPAGDGSEPELVVSQLSRAGKNSLYLAMLPIFLDLLEEPNSISGMISTR